MEKEKKICEECSKIGVLWYSARKGHLECVKLFLETGTLEAGLENALRDAAWGGHPECMKLLIEFGVSTKILTEEALEKTLYTTADTGQLECMKLLFESGWGVNAEILSWALRHATCEGHLKCMQLLLERGAKIKNSFHEGLQNEFLELPVYLFPQLLLQEHLWEEIKEKMKERLQKEKKDIIKWKKEVKFI